MNAPKQPSEIADELVAELDELAGEIERGEWQDPESDPHVVRAGELSAELAAAGADEETLARVHEAYERTAATAAAVRDRARSGLRQTAAFRQHAKALGAAYAIRRGRMIDRSE